MRVLSFIPALLLVGSTALSAWAADLTKIDRTITKEPAYQGTPKYCLLVFGPEAKTRVWLVRDDNALYVDRNGNGDLTETGTKAAWNEPYSRWESAIRGPDAKRYVLSVQKFQQAQSGYQLSIHNGAQRGYIVGDPDADVLVFADRPSKASVVHIGGPLSIDLRYQGNGGSSVRLRVRVGTVGLGQGAFAGLVLEDVAPVAEIEFPSKNPGGPPIRMKAPLKNR
jgi:hypothetical protein